MFGRATITLGIGPHSSCCCFWCYGSVCCWVGSIKLDPRSTVIAQRDVRPTIPRVRYAEVMVRVRVMVRVTLSRSSLGLRLV